MTLVGKQRIETRHEQAILILSHLSLLTQQTHARFRSRVPGLSTGILQGTETPSPMANVVVSTMQTSRIPKHAEWLKQNLIRPIGLIMVDEAHMFPAKSYQVIRSYYPEAQILGFTATPFRERQVMTSCFAEIAYSISLQELIDLGVLVPPELHQITKRDTDATDVAATVVRLYLEKESGRKAIVYMRTIEDAKLTRNAFESAGVRCRAVTSECTGDGRDDVLDEFTNGSIDVLTTVDVLTAGFDSPPVQAIFMPYGTKSPTQYLQRIGRGLRPHNDKTSCRVYVFGPPPQIGKDRYRAQHYDVLNAGASLNKTFDRVSDEMKYKFLDPAGDVYHWNHQVLEVVAKMKALGMGYVSDLVDRRDFPKKYLANVTTLLNSMPDKRQYMANGHLHATDAQKDLLFRRGFSGAQLSKISKYEASMLISTTNGHGRSQNHDPSFIMPEGIYKGRPVWETPHTYRHTVKRTHPDSPVAQVIQRWEQRPR